MVNSLNDRFPSLYKILSKTIEQYELDKEQIGSLYLGFLSNVSENAKVSCQKTNRTKYLKKIKRLFQEETRIFFSSLFFKGYDTIWNVSAEENIPILKSNTHIPSIEKIISKIYSKTRDYKSIVGENVIIGAKNYHETMKDSPLGFVSNLDLEYDSILDKFREVIK